MKKLLFGLLGLLVTISGWSAETNSGPISSVTVAGLVEQNGTPTPDAPIDIVSNNGVLKASKNLYNPATRINGSYINESGIVTSGSYFVYSALIPASPNTIYTLSAVPSTASGARRIHAYDKNGNWIQQLNYATSPGSAYVLYGTTPANAAYIRISIRNDDTNVQVEENPTATPYMPYGEIYTDGTVETIGDSANHTATVATLLGIGDYRDTQNINTGAITRNVGVKVLDGTENWQTTSQPAVYRWESPVLFSLPNVCICSHYAGVSTDLSISNMPDMSAKTGFAGNSNVYIKDSSFSGNLTGFKQSLAAQYAAGTPVIIIYPLATPTTESVAGQTMTTAPVNNRTGGVAGMTITTLLSSGASVVTTIAANAIKIATTAYNSARFSPVVTELNDTIATIRSVVTNTINQTKAIADLQATKQTRPDENCPAGKKCLLVEDDAGMPHWYEIIENAD